MKLFGYIGRKAVRTSTLATQLQHYSPYTAPHTANPVSLEPAQALENLAYLQNNKAQRLDTLHELLTLHGIAIKPALQGEPYEPMVESLYRWAQQEWPQAAAPAVAQRAMWRETTRQDNEIIYSLVMDCAIALGELVIHHRPDFSWAVDLDPQNIKDQMPSAHRVVLQAPSLSHPGQHVLIDWEELTVAMLLNPTSAANRVINLWQRVCAEAISGATQGQHV